MRYQQLITFGLTASLLASCAMTPRETRDNSGIELIQEELAAIEEKPAVEEALPPPQVDDALLPPLMGDSRGTASSDLFDVSVDEVSARDFFMGLVKGTPYNMVVHPDVQGTISLELQNVDIEEVMTVVNDVYGYSYKKRGNLYQILPGGLRSEVFHIDYLSLKRSGVSETQVTNGEVTDAGTSNSGGSSSDSNNNSNNRNNNNNSGSGGGNVGAQIRTETESDFWTELQQTLTVLVGEGDGRRVIVTPQAGIIVIRAMPEEIDTAKDFLRRAEIIMRRQVVLEAKILEVQLSDSYQTGIDWTAVADVNGNDLVFGVNGSSVVSPSGIGGAFSGAFTSDDFTGVIQLLETQGSVQVLSSPRISTVNNQKAVIKVGQDEFFVTEISNTTTTSTGTTTNNPEIELTPFFSGIALDVTPQISEDDEIILHIHPSISDVEDQVKVITLGDQVVELPLALSTIRETDSVVYARSGQVVVLGGLMQNRSLDNNSGTPVFGDMPFVGHLFSQQRNVTVKNELVILLKPVIMGPDGLPEATRRSQQRFDEFRRVLDTSYGADDEGGSIE
ncbi:pilus (MSHA type) biogenesis protein MshL [Oceanicoccus sagamiensis]|uniref:Pilus (MSHA type) biogenesis protein MshL n=1 Tax=Oceanicoccus sagamiensis TaxID=716816 RepID=A0A1X9N929_9GAMM|nr:pilus (MSHA type) biogenesis protein MshL [Oceanicoccus sagamiensis]ARN73594.1 pilus (MSHA type) biogenesis protein MshL [Oceanicoccus sagamiensis]